MLQQRTEEAMTAAQAAKAAQHELAVERILNEEMSAILDEVRAATVPTKAGALETSRSDAAPRT